MYRDTHHAVYLKDYRPPEFLVERVDLYLELDAEATVVQATLEMHRNPAAPRGDGDLILDGEQLTLLDLALDGQPLTPAEYVLDACHLRVRRVPDRFRLTTRVRIQPCRNTALEGLYQSGEMLCTQCEAEGFRRITFYPDRPDVMARFSTTLVAERARYPVLLANGNPSAAEDLGDGRHLVRWDDPFPKPCYLFALVAGDLCMIEDRFCTVSGREIALAIYVEPHNVDKCGHAMASLKQAMRWDEQCFGREYDLDRYMIVAVSTFNMGAMENKGLNVFNDKYVLAEARTATDADYAGIESVIAHEYFHNWTGNRITCRDWFQLSLKEGLTVFRDQEFSADMGSRAVQRIRDARTLQTQQFAEDASPLAHSVRPDSYVEINNFYTTTVYEKGAEVVRMQANLLGPELFRAATDLYFARHDGQAVTTDDFVRCMEDASGRDLTQFRRWYSQAGTPELLVETHYDAERGEYRLTFSQRTPPTPGQPEKQPLHIPVAIGLLGRSGAVLPIRLADEPLAAGAEEDSAENGMGTRVFELRAARETFCCVGLDEPPVVSLLRGFSAPVKLHCGHDEADLLVLMRHDRDGYSRWNAAQRLFERLLLQSLAAPADLLPTIPAVLFETLAELLENEADAQPALLAELLTLPGENALAERMQVVDVDAIHRVRGEFERLIGARLADTLAAVYAASERDGPYEYTSQAAGRRALKNLALRYWMAADAASAHACCQAQFEAARNMTDELAALRLLVDYGATAADAALARFHQRWSNEPLVLDKWFSVQACSPRTDTLARVEGLLGCADFSLCNPNRVRSLIGAFASANPVCFHAADGSGYRFLADRVLEIDPLNPQLAARLLKSMVRWQRFDTVRQTLMCAELSRVLRAEALSPDVCEVASKALYVETGPDSRLGA